MNRYRAAFLFDCFLYLGRHGLWLALLSAIVAVVLVFAAAPAWVTWGLAATAGILCLYSAWRLQGALHLCRHGEAVKGRIQTIEKKVSTGGGSDGGKRVRKRAVFTYEWHGAQHEGRTPWQTGLGALAPGATIEVLVDPGKPERAAWADALPLRLPWWSDYAD